MHILNGKFNCSFDVVLIKIFGLTTGLDANEILTNREAQIIRNGRTGSQTSVRMYNY